MIQSFDHVAVPMKSVEAMLSFYSKLGCNIVEEYEGYIHAVYIWRQQNKFSCASGMGI